ncbi:hypothetical protein [Saccharicrinis aurantiacus]|uniref:hypothetical protein n=1 Tax=Saccharicrinis aurantiacus TaxID=1849719 RepID=UPI002490A1DE|nr:hypothetical protein [Saccharicrinis aurantiacus]
MKRYITKLVLFLFPLTCVLPVVFVIDFFKINGFQDYYSTQKVGLNREMITTKTFNFYREKEKYDSFIFGSSRSNAFKIKEWKPHLNLNSRGFHFDASGEGIWGISKKVQYIFEAGDTIRNALIIIDRELLAQTEINKGHLFIPMPCVSKSSNVEYYYSFFRASLSPKFLIAYCDYYLFGKYRDYMGFLIRNNHYPKSKANSINCDVWYGEDVAIKNDSAGYYQELIEKGIFVEPSLIEPIKCNVTDKEVELLTNIKEVFNKHKTNYKIVISPIYDQIPLEKEQLELLYKIFGERNIYNFSGKNKYTQTIHNYYETSHYRPHVASEIMDIIYQCDIK